MRSDKWTPSLAAAGLTLATVVFGACGATSVPREATPIPIARYLEVGAMMDSSRGYPVAFYANPAAEPAIIALDTGVGSTDLHASQWTTDLARALNLALAKVSRFDERFKPVAQDVFNYEIHNGEMIYAWHEPAGGPDFGLARVAKLRLLEFKTSSGSGEGTSALITMQVDLPNFSKRYGCEKAAVRWDLEAFTCIGEKILGDEAFWTAVAAKP